MKAAIGASMAGLMLAGAALSAVPAPAQAEEPADALAVEQSLPAGDEASGGPVIVQDEESSDETLQRRRRALGTS